MGIEKICESCGEKFECNAADIANCFCNTMALNREALDPIKTKYFDCLCGKCFADLSSVFLKDDPSPDNSVG